MNTVIDSFDLHKFLISLYDDHDIIGEFSEILYSILDQYDIYKFCFDDYTKSITVTLTSLEPMYRQSTMNMISIAFSSFVLKIIRSSEFQFLINQHMKDSNQLNNYNKIISLDDVSLTKYALSCVTVLDMSTSKEVTVFRINLKN